MKHVFYQLLLALAFSGAAFAGAGHNHLPVLPAGAVQTIKGNVKDPQGAGLPGVNVIVKGTQRGTVTNADGDFTIETQPGDAVLVFSFVGYQSVEETIGSRTEISVELTHEDRALDEIVVVGYGTQKKRDVTGAVGSVKGSDVKSVVAADASALLQGRLAGVTVQQGGSAPGQAPAVVIRGTGTFGNDQPLYVIDGMIAASMSYINPNDIESMEVLKDASAAAIYGSRAANGVVLVTTKSGKAGDVKVSLNVKGGIQTPSKKLKFLNARQYADWNNQAHDNDGLERAPGNDAKFDPAIDTDWQSLELGSAPMTDYNLSLSGGSNTAKYFISGQYFDQKGIATDSWFKRYNMRANSQFNKGRFKFTESLSLSRSINNPNTYVGRETGPLPTMAVYDAKNQGGYAGLDPAFAGVARVVNWYGLAHMDDNRYTTDQVLGNIGLEYEIIDGLRYKLNVGLDYSVYRQYDFTPAFFMSNSQEAFQQQATLNDSYIQSFTTLVENTLTYNKSFGDHNFEVLAGYTTQNGQARSLGATAANFPSNDLRVINAAINRTVNTNGDLQEFVLQSALARINYNYKSKYLLTATIRRDGSSKFLYPHNTFATFPSFSLGWRVSEESFFPKTDLFNDLKLRGSYGTLGSQNIGNYLTSPTFNLTSDYYFAGGAQPGIAVTQYVNPDLKWESTKTSDIGFDLSMLRNAITISADYFDKTSSDVLASIPIPAYGGAGSTLTKNAATINNKGFEMAVTYARPAGKDFNYSITGTFSTVKNRVISLGDGVSPIIAGGFTQQSLQATRTDVGQPIGSFWGYQVLGIYQSKQEATEDGRTDATAGDFKFSKEPTWLGSPFPKFNYGANFNATYKNFDFGLFFQGVSGNKIWNAKGRFQYILDYGSNKSPEVLNAWTPENTNTDIPRATQLDPANNKRSSSFYIEDGSYVRLKNLTIGYTLPQSLLNKAKISNARFYVSGQNLLTFTKYKGYDPEVGRNSNGGSNPNNIGSLLNNGVDQTAYPNARIMSIGLDLNF
ncbi:SusC/RagA family TonB-linked outer membrane protein [Dyadobacter sandarakinus]|uniref:TonB-dependent receptor n=1 Tax=Dyadobacter sandarakinus TaxID=2747268 RepID=A0ABX7I495_9BACT|nr:TonB-dependent receptor [Dyadobacter sandarakinus]QRR00690.1 TonB-dependent receptor [Dyadobacter sandarakinus]